MSASFRSPKTLSPSRVRPFQTVSAPASSPNALNASPSRRSSRASAPVESPPSPPPSSSHGSLASSSDDGLRDGGEAEDIPQWVWGGPPPGPGQLLYLKEHFFQAWLVALVLGEHPSRNGFLFVAHTNGTCDFLDPADSAFDECIVTDFEDVVPEVVATGYYEGFTSIPGGGSWDDLLEWGASELASRQRDMLRGGGKRSKAPKAPTRRLLPISKSMEWRRDGGKWYALAVIEEDQKRGIAGINIGDIITPIRDKGQVFGDHGLAFHSYNRAVPVMWVADGHHASWVKSTSLVWKDLVKSPLPVDDEDEDATPRGRPVEKSGAQKGSALEEDIRILPIQIERADNRRHRRLEDAQPLFVEDDFEDWPLDGDRTMMHGARELRRQGLTFTSHHDKWALQSGVTQSSRALKEHKVLCQALHYMTTYDQLNLPNIAAAELLNLRRQLIESAHEYNPDLPDYGAAEDFMGSHDNARGAIIDPRRVAFVAARQGARAKVLEQSRKAKEERSMYLTRSTTTKKDDDPSGAAADAQPAGPRAKKK